MMEKDAAKRMFQRSIDFCHMKYTLYAGDGDSSSFKVVHESMKNKTYGASYCVEKE